MNGFAACFVKREKPRYRSSDMYDLEIPLHTRRKASDPREDALQMIDVFRQGNTIVIDPFPVSLIALYLRKIYKGSSLSDIDLMRIFIVEHLPSVDLEVR